MKMLSRIFWVAIFVWLLWRTQSTTGPTVDEQIPSFKGTTLTGQQIDQNALKGRVTVLEFWATWCPACISSLPTFQRLTQRIKQQTDAQTISVHVPRGASRTAIEQFMKRNGYDFRVVLDQTGALSAAFQIESIPTLVIVDKDGVVRKVKNGRLFGDEETIIEWLKPWRGSNTGSHMRSWGSISKTVLSP